MGRERNPGWPDGRLLTDMLDQVSINPYLMILEIVNYPAPVLRQTGTRIEEVTGEIRELAENMLETMYEAQGVGLAAQQVGHALQLAIVDVSHDIDCVTYCRVNGDEVGLEDICPLIFINPEIKPVGAKETESEGCLSFPDLRADITRKGEVVANVETLDGEKLTIETDGLFSRAIQHEVDHLFGKLFIDRMTSARKLAIKKKLKEMQETYG